MKRYRYIPKHRNKDGRSGGSGGRKGGAAAPGGGGFAPIPAPGGWRSSQRSRGAQSGALVPEMHAPGCGCSLVPGWLDAEVRIAVLPSGTFPESGDTPFVFRLFDVTPEPGKTELSAEEKAHIARGMFTFLVRQGRENEDLRALVDQLEAQGGPVFGEPVDLRGSGSGKGEVIVQIAAVLPDPADLTDPSDAVDAAG